jgi:hypothetical protein
MITRFKRGQKAQTLVDVRTITRVDTLYAGTCITVLAYQRTQNGNDIYTVTRDSDGAVFAISNLQFEVLLS